MATKSDKIYVAIGNNDPQEGLLTLEWALQKWSSHSISIVILHIGILPTSYVKEGENDKLLSKYKAFCGKVKAEIFKIEKDDEPLNKIIVKLISGYQITKLVMGITFVKSLPGGSFYVHRHKPEFCELFVICGGQLISVGEENGEGIMEVEWENYVKEMENYFHEILPGKCEEDGPEVEKETSLWNSQEEQVMLKNVSVADKVEILKIRIREAQNVIQLKRKEAKANVERQARAEWAICLCTSRAKGLEACINEETAKGVHLKKELYTAKEKVCEVRADVEARKSKLKSIIELQPTLSNKLQLSSLARSKAEARLENAVIVRADMVREIEELRRQRDVLQRRIEFCREKVAIGRAYQ
ncbi:U-box domain-containing protein kinase family protein [Actinidia rufa]|uniref:RING-type E3 ubiquitin transferase n=1 Tax=Actinidia rufa TaxID=165716 RepID=A0A7J0EXW1_9ERIC|nr:U-box domain-containing protein kinase family protein [Actinidia rufa]